MFCVAETSYCMNEPFDHAGAPPDMINTCPSVVGEGVQFNAPPTVVYNNETPDGRAVGNISEYVEGGALTPEGESSEI